MAHWKKEAAMQELTELIDEISKVKKADRFSARHKGWQLRCLTFLQEVFGKGLFYREFALLTWQKAEVELRFALMEGIQRHGVISEDDLKMQHWEGYQADLEKAKGILEAAKDRLSKVAIADVYDTTAVGQESNALMRILNLAQQDLRKIIRQPPDKEIQIQDAFENLLVGAGLKYSREKVSIEYSSKKYIPDFTLDQLNLAVDLKLCGRHAREKEIISEINDDILAYQTSYKNLLFIIYDIGNIRDVEKFLGSFKKNAGTFAVVVKH